MELSGKINLEIENYDDNVLLHFNKTYDFCSSDFEQLLIKLKQDIERIFSLEQMEVNENGNRK